MSSAVADIFRSVANYLFFGNIFIACCALGLYLVTCLVLAVAPPPLVAVLVVLATILLYNSDSLLPYKLQQQVVFSERRAWVQAHRQQILLLIALTLAGTLYLFFQVRSLLPIGFLGHLAVISVLYSVPALPTATGWKPLRHIPLLKIFLIAYVWTSVTVWLPVLAVQQSIYTSKVWFLFFQQFLFILALTIVFDIRDVARDKNTGTLTLPVLVGVNRAQYFSWFVLAGYLALVLFTLQGTDRIALILAGLVVAWVVWQAGKPQREYFYVVAADGMMLLQFLLLWILREGLS